MPSNLPTRAQQAGIEATIPQGIADAVFTVNDLLRIAVCQTQENGGGGGGATGGLTDTQLRASPVPVSLSTLPVTNAGTFAVQVTSAPTTAVTGPLTDAQLRATPVPVTGSFSVTGTLTDAELRASAVPVSLNSTSISNFPASQAVTNAGTFAVQVTSAPTTTVTGAVTANAGSGTFAVSGPLTDAQLRATAVPVSGTFFQATQPVSAVSLPLPSGAATAALQTQPGVDIGDVTVNNGSGAAAVNIQDGGNSITVDGTVAVSGSVAVTGTFWQATQPVSGTITANAGSGTMAVSLASLPSLPTGSNVIGAVTQSGTWTATPTVITKGTQGATGYTTQDLKDAGRTAVNYYAVAAAAGATGVETAITLTKSSGTSATSTGTSHTPTSGKRFRIEAICVATRGHATATAQTTTFNLRINTAGAVTTSSTPIVLAARSATPATANAWDRVIIPIPDGYEIAGDGTLQFGITAAATYTTNAPTWDVTIIGYEY